MKKIFPILGNSTRLDGGAMFGNAPKALWSRWVDVDENNTIALCCRCLLIQDGQRNILLETGIGSFFDPKLRQRYGVVEDQHVLLDSLAKHGLSDADIDIVVLSHLHFDHAGGLLAAWQADQPAELLFNNARYLVGADAWERANQPHYRDRASFIPALNTLLAKSGRLDIIDGKQSPLLGEDYSFIFSDGHTPGMMHTVVRLPEYSVIFAADLIPGSAWVHLPISMGYDRFPEQLINEKQALLNDVVKNQDILFFTHDPEIAFSRVEKNDKQHFIPTPIEL